jgi:exosome complex component RRP42
MFDQEILTHNLMKDYIRDLVEKGQRIDGRGLYEYRPIEVLDGTFTKAEGEAWLKLGETQVLVGVKADLGEPFPDTPDKGVFVSNAELLPVASPTFEPGPPDEGAIELARIVDRAIRSADAIDLGSLVILPGKLVYMIFLDMYVLDYDGNLEDSLTLASLIALGRSEIPEVELKGDGEIEVKERKRKLELKDIPINFSFVKIGSKILLDPTIEEESVSDASITVAINKDGKVCSIQKKHGTFKVEEILNIVSVAKSKWPELARVVREAI